MQWYVKVELFVAWCEGTILSKPGIYIPTSGPIPKAGPPVLWPLTDQPPPDYERGEAKEVGLQERISLESFTVNRGRDPRLE